MPSKKFECTECGALGTIKFNQDIGFQVTDISTCPFCAADISNIHEDEENDD